jgi:hypothetical protein
MLRCKSAIFFWSLIILTGCSRDPILPEDNQVNWQKQAVTSLAADGNGFESYAIHGFIHHTPANRVFVGRMQSGSFFEQCPSCNDEWLQLTPIYGLVRIQTLVQRDSNRVFFSASEWYDPSSNYAEFLYSSTDGGINWQKTLLNAPGGLICFRNDTSLFFDRNRYHRDSSGNWQLVSALPIPNVFFDNYFMDMDWVTPTTCLIPTARGGLYSYNSITDQVTTVNASVKLRAVEQVSGGVLVGIADTSRLVRSTDGGVTWQTVFDPATLLQNKTGPLSTVDLKALQDQQTIFATVSFYADGATNPGTAELASGNHAPVKSMILKSYDAGLTWSLNYHSSYMRFSQLDVYDENYIVAYGYSEKAGVPGSAFYLYTVTRGE